MKEKVIFGYFRFKAACMRALESFRREERGDAGIVATLLMIVIVIAVAAIFREQLLKIVTEVFEKLMVALGLDG